MKQDTEADFTRGLSLLDKPVLPLVNMVQFMYLKGPFVSIEEVISRLTKPVELAGIEYDRPQTILKPYVSFLREFEVLKGRKRVSGTMPFIINEKQEPVAKHRALEIWLKQQIVDQELELINSSLCGPCGCVLCCTGPNSRFDAAAGYKGTMKQKFFEIPLAEKEIELFPVSRVDSQKSREMSPMDDPPLYIDRVPFYDREAALYNWRNGWSLIMPEGSVCPNLATPSGRCEIYQKRPAVCRKPQIFAYVLEKTADTAKRSDGAVLPVYLIRNKVLAVWDCPYVRRFQDKIGVYAEMSGLEPVFKKSKR